MALKYQGSRFLNFAGALQVPGRIPLDIRAVVATENDLYLPTTWGKVSNDGSEVDTTVVTAYNGMTVAVLENNGLYMCIDEDNFTTAGGWKRLDAPDLSVSGKMIDVVNEGTEEAPVYVWYDEDLNRHIIKDSSVNEAGKYLLLSIGDTEVYINSKDLVSLDNYYTKEEIDSSVNTALAQINTSITNINTNIQNINDAINNLDSSVQEIDDEVAGAKDRLDGIDTELEDINSSISNLDSSVADLQDQVDGIKKEIKEGVVTSVDASVTGETAKKFILQQLLLKLRPVKQKLVSMLQLLMQKLQNSKQKQKVQ